MLPDTVTVSVSCPASNGKGAASAGPTARVAARSTGGGLPASAWLTWASCNTQPRAPNA